MDLTAIKIRFGDQELGNTCFRELYGMCCVVVRDDADDDCVFLGDQEVVDIVIQVNVCFVD